MYQMKLSRSANHEPVRGYWARVCETCYKSRDGYNDHNGLSNDHTKTLTEMRRKRVERQTLEISRLEKRLTKLTRLLADSPDGAAVSNGSLLGPMSNLSGQKNSRKVLEQSVVTWEDDNAVSKCPFCQQEFRSWTFRRHHCRICGRVVCADIQTQCSSEVPLTVATCRSAYLLYSSIDTDCCSSQYLRREATNSCRDGPAQRRRPDVQGLQAHHLLQP